MLRRGKCGAISIRNAARWVFDLDTLPILRIPVSTCNATQEMRYHFEMHPNMTHVVAVIVVVVATLFEIL